MSKLSIVWFESYACNNKCPYCCVLYRMQESVEKQGTKTIKHSWQEWVKQLNSLNPSVIDISGGEPFLNPNMVDILKGLNCELGITSNATQDFTRLVQEVDPKKLLGITLSYHPSQNTITRDYFLGQCLLLRNRGFRVSVNFVTYPAQMYLAPMLQQLFENYNIRFHVDPYADIPSKPYVLNEAERQFIEPYISKDRQSKRENNGQAKPCSAGRDYIVIQPNGLTQRCMFQSMSDKKPMGNIFDPDFKLFTDNPICADQRQCNGCDRDKATIYD